MQLLNVTTLPIYLPYDTAPVPFGDPFLDISSSGASPDVWTVPGYNSPKAGDVVAFTVPSGGSLDASYTAGQNYYVVSPSNDTFEVSATKGGSAIGATSAASTGIAVHLLSEQVDGTVIPFKTGNTVLAINLSSGTLVLQGASDSVPPSVGNYVPPSGPGSWNTIKSLTAGTMALVQLSYDWIRVSTSGTIALLQN